VSRKAREKAAIEAKKQRDIEAKRKAIEAESCANYARSNAATPEERKRQERRDAEERKRQETLERKMHSKPYANDTAFLEELRGHCW